MVAITQQNFFSNVWRTIYDVLRNNLTDPNSRGKIWTYAAFPDITESRFCGYPVVVIENPDVSDEKLSYKGTVRRDDVSIFISVYAKDKANVDTVFDDVRYQLRQNESSVIGDGLRNMRINSTRPGDLDVGGDTVHFSVMEVRFNHA